MVGILLGISHRSPLITSDEATSLSGFAGNQSPFPFDNIGLDLIPASDSWESVTVPL